jgi:sugar O-acyltransferase (sialic acid O-acetyltransferase NeuD family)
MPIEQLVILGAGGHAKVVLDAVRLVWPDACIEVRDDDPNKRGCQLLGFTVIVPIGELVTLPADNHVAIGDNEVRKRVAQGLLACGKRLRTVTHPRATVSSAASVGDGVFLAAAAIVAPDAEIGAGVIVNHGAVVDHDCRVGAWTHVAPRAVLGGGVTVGEGCLIGGGAVVLPGVRIGNEATIGAGAVVARNVPPGTIVVGVPARERARRD